MDIEKITKKTVELGQLSLLFARTNRITLHEDGVTPESDTDHTVMLGLCACAIASSYAPHLNLGKIAQFALVHDLVEAYAGDTSTIDISDELRKKKDEKEHEAFLRIKSEFEGVFPWIHTTIEEYETLASEEAKFIKTLDKCMPKITHLLNNGTALVKVIPEKEDARNNFNKLVKTLGESYGKNHRMILDLLSNLGKQTLEASYKE